MSKPAVTPIEGQALRLRLLEEADLARTLAWRNQDHIRRWFVHSDPISSAQHRAWFDAYQQRSDDFLFVIEETVPTLKPVGQVGLYRLDRARQAAEFGRLLIGESDARGRGLARKAAALLLGHGFNAWHLQIIELEVFADNQPALAVYRRCGFVPVGLADGLLKMQATPSTYAGALAGGSPIAAAA